MPHPASIQLRSCNQLEQEPHSVQRAEWVSCSARLTRPLGCAVGNGSPSDGGEAVRLVCQSLPGSQEAQAWLATIPHQCWAPSTSLGKCGVSVVVFRSVHISNVCQSISEAQAQQNFLLRSGLYKAKEQ